MLRLAWLACALTAASPPAAGEEYSVGPGDVLHVAVLGQAELTGDFSVGAGGALKLPFVGEVPVAGLATPAIEERIRAVLADGYLKRPQVSVSVKEFKSQRVFVTGEVVRPGPYGLRPERSLRALLGEVGELGANAGHEIVVVRPPVQDAAAPPEEQAAPRVRGLPGEVPGAQVFRVSLRELRSGNPEKDVRLEPGDTVYVPKAAQFYVTGNVNRPGAFRFEEGISVFQALNMAGGVTPRGSSKGVRVVRLVDGQQKEFKVQASDLVEPEDTIVVPERFFD
jgi:polysaccharide export outer membrane protein